MSTIPIRKTITVIPTCEELALTRYKDGNLRGFDPEPWGRGTLRNVRDGREEAADGWNYASWAAVATHNAQVKTLAAYARTMFGLAYGALKQAEEIEGGVAKNATTDRK